MPWLLVHGDQDELVPLTDAEAVRVATGGRAQLVVLPGADHRCRGHAAAMVAAVVPWLARVLAT